MWNFGNFLDPFDNFNLLSAIMAPFAGLEVLDQPAAPPHILLFIKPAKQCSLTHNQPISAKFQTSERGL